jgi:hypothetical protein
MSDAIGCCLCGYRDGIELACKGNPPTVDDMQLAWCIGFVIGRTGNVELCAAHERAVGRAYHDLEAARSRGPGIGRA